MQTASALISRTVGRWMSVGNAAMSADQIVVMTNRNKAKKRAKRRIARASRRINRQRR